MSVPTWVSQALFLGLTAYLLPYRVVIRPAYRDWRKTHAPLVSKTHVLQLLFALLCASGGGLIAHAIVLHSVGADDRINLWLFLLGFALVTAGCIAGLAGTDAARDDREGAATTELMTHVKHGPAGHEMDVV